MAALSAVVFALSWQASVAQTALTVLLFTSLAIAIGVQVLADPLAGMLDRLAFSRSPALLAERIARLKPRDGGDFGTTEQWRRYNSLYFPYVVGVRAYAQNATAAGLDPTARQAWQWLVADVPQRSLHNWQTAAARLIAADLRGRVPVSSS